MPHYHAATQHLMENMYHDMLVCHITEGGLPEFHVSYRNN